MRPITRLYLAGMACHLAALVVILVAEGRRSSRSSLDTRNGSRKKQEEANP